MADKIIAITSIALSGASFRIIEHHDTAMFYAVVFFAIGLYEFIRSEKNRKSK